MVFSSFTIEESILRFNVTLSIQHLRKSSLMLWPITSHCQFVDLLTKCCSLINAVLVLWFTIYPHFRCHLMCLVRGLYIHTCDHKAIWCAMYIDTLLYCLYGIFFKIFLTYRVISKKMTEFRAANEPSRLELSLIRSR